MPYRQEAIGLSRFLSWPEAIALGAGLSLAVQLTLTGELLRHSHLGIFGIAALLYLPLLLTWLDLPGEHGPLGLVRLAGYPRLAFWVAWIELAGLCALSALLAQGAAAGLLGSALKLWPIELSQSDLVTMVIGLVALNELLGTRAHSKPAVWWVSMLTVVLILVLVSEALGLGGELETAPVSSSPSSHALLAPALLASLLWGPHLMLSRRRLIRRRAGGAWLPTLALWGLLPLIGTSILWLGAWMPGLGLGNGRSTPSKGLDFGLMLLIVVTAMCLVGLSQAMAGSLRLLTAMGMGGIVPRGWIDRRSERGAPLLPLIMLAVACGGAARFIELPHLAGLSALAILWLSPLVLWPHIRKTLRDLPNGSRLPFHPLIPALVSVGCLFLSLVLYGVVLWLAALWLTVGLLYFLTYARSGLARLEMETHSVGELPPVADPARPRMMVAVGGAPTCSTLVQIAGCLAAQRGAELLVLKIEPMIEQVPWLGAKDLAEQTLEHLQDTLRGVRLPESVQIRPLVRVAPNIASGILDAAGETGAEFLLLGWPRENGRSDVEPIIEKVFSASPIAMAVIHGTLPNKVGRILVATAGGPHAAVALEVAEALGTQRTGVVDTDGDSALTGASEVALLNVLTPRPAVAKGKAALNATLEKRFGAGGNPSHSGLELGEVLVSAPSVGEGIEREAGLQDVLVMGASVDRLLGQTRLEGLATDIAESRQGLTIVVRRQEAAPRFWGRRIWQWMSNPLPRLTDEQRIKVQLAMRRAARADADFYVLISLSAAIATLGLMQSSAPVVIGAMLVAPLMSPILAMGHAMVRGHLRLVRRSATSTLKGVGIAVVVGSIFPLIFPGISATPEILARGQPSLLDLAVALASGAAAAYAVSRPSVAAALPGVAIAAALVPPLCVVGFGLGASQLALAGGAMLLFATNLCAIVLAAAIVFLMMGFRPRTVESGGHVWRSLAWAILGLMLVSVPLGLQTRDVLRSSQVERFVTERLGTLAEGPFHLDAVRFDRQGEALWIRVELRAFSDDLPVDQLEALRRDLERELGKEAHFDYIISRSRRLVLSGDALSQADPPER